MSNLVKQLENEGSRGFLFLIFFFYQWSLSSLMNIAVMLFTWCQSINQSIFSRSMAYFLTPLVNLNSVLIITLNENCSLNRLNQMNDTSSCEPLVKVKNYFNWHQWQGGYGHFLLTTKASLNPVTQLKCKYFQTLT